MDGNDTNWASWPKEKHGGIESIFLTAEAKQAL